MRGEKHAVIDWKQGSFYCVATQIPHTYLIAGAASSS